MKLKSILLATAATAVCSMGHATEGDLGDLGATPKLHVTSIATNDVTFKSKFFFDIAEQSTLWADATDWKQEFAGQTFLDISNLSLKLFDSSDTLLATGTAVGDDSYHIDNFAIDAGEDYYLLVEGTTDGLLGGGYALTALAGPIPEPDSMALLALGLMGIGLMRSRKSER